MRKHESIFHCPKPFFFHEGIQSHRVELSFTLTKNLETIIFRNTLLNNFNENDGFLTEISPFFIFIWLHTFIQSNLRLKPAQHMALKQNS